MTSQRTLTPIDGNSHFQSMDAVHLDPLSAENTRPVPAFLKESQQHRSLHSKLLGQEKSGKQAGKYVSPSDDLMSPASAKLNAFKEKRFTKTAKPRTLFAKTTSTTAYSNGAAGLEEELVASDKSQQQKTWEDDSKMKEG